MSANDYARFTSQQRLALQAERQQRADRRNMEVNQGNPNNVQPLQPRPAEVQIQDLIGDNQEQVNNQEIILNNGGPANNAINNNQLIGRHEEEGNHERASQASGSSTTSYQSIVGRALTLEATTLENRSVTYYDRVHRIILELERAEVPAGQTQENIRLWASLGQIQDTSPFNRQPAGNNNVRQQTSNNQNTQPQRIFKMPTAKDMQPFCGRASRWSTFVLLFKEIILTNPFGSQVLKLEILSVLVPQHRDLILTHHTCQDAIDIVAQQYSSSTALWSDLLQDIREVPTLTSRSGVAEWRKLESAILCAQRCISSTDQAWLAQAHILLKGKLGPLWTKYNYSKKGDSLSDLHNLVTKQINGLRKAEQERCFLQSVPTTNTTVKSSKSQGRPSAEPVSPQAITAATVQQPTTSNNVPIEPCYFCGQNHRRIHCHLSRVQRRAGLEQQERCLNCLLPRSGHQCAGTGCRRCRSPYHTLICLCQSAANDSMRHQQQPSCPPPPPPPYGGPSGFSSNTSTPSTSSSVPSAQFHTQQAPQSAPTSRASQQMSTHVISIGGKVSTTFEEPQANPCLPRRPALDRYRLCVECQYPRVPIPYVPVCKCWSTPTTEPSQKSQPLQGSSTISNSNDASINEANQPTESQSIPVSSIADVSSTEHVATAVEERDSLTCFTTNSEAVFLPTLKLYVNNLETSLASPVRTLLDEASTTSFISESVLTQLGIEKVPVKPFTVSAFGGSARLQISWEAKITIQSMTDPRVTSDISVFVMSGILVGQLPAATSEFLEAAQRFGILLTDFSSQAAYVPIDLLIGQDLYTDHFLLSLQRSYKFAKGLAFVNSRFGWTLQGTAGGRRPRNMFVNCAYLSTSTGSQLPLTRSLNSSENPGLFQDLTKLLLNPRNAIARLTALSKNCLHADHRQSVHILKPDDKAISGLEVSQASLHAAPNWSLLKALTSNARKDWFHTRIARVTPDRVPLVNVFKEQSNPLSLPNHVREAKQLSRITLSDCPGLQFVWSHQIFPQLVALKTLPSGTTSSSSTLHSSTQLASPLTLRYTENPLERRRAYYTRLKRPTRTTISSLQEVPFQDSNNLANSNMVNSMQWSTKRRYSSVDHTNGCRVTLYAHLDSSHLSKLSPFRKKQAALPKVIPQSNLVAAIPTRLLELSSQDNWFNLTSGYDAANRVPCGRAVHLLRSQLPRCKVRKFQSLDTFINTGRRISSLTQVRAKWPQVHAHLWTHDDFLSQCHYASLTTEPFIKPKGRPPETVVHKFSIPNGHLHLAGPVRQTEVRFRWLILCICPYPEPGWRLPNVDRSTLHPETSLSCPQLTDPNRALRGWGECGVSSSPLIMSSADRTLFVTNPPPPVCHTRRFIDSPLKAISLSHRRRWSPSGHRAVTFSLYKLAPG